MKTSEIKNIDEESYEFFQLSPKVAIRTASKLFGIVGGSLAKAAGSVEKGSGSFLDSNIDFSAVGEALLSLGDRLDDEKVIDIFTTMLDVTFWKGQKVSWEHPNFQGRPLHLIKVVKGALEVNFADFFDVAFGSLASQKGQGTTQASLTSIGGSGDQSSVKSPPLRRSKVTGA